MQAGIDATLVEKWLAASQTDAVKAQLKSESDFAVSTGAYGAPWMLVRREGEPDSAAETFFGSDRFEQMALLYKLPYRGPIPTGPASKL
jgi:2-hydroxychromene-2-carboxylate isomerase